jgi:hypothetical protein
MSENKIRVLVGPWKIDKRGTRNNNYRLGSTVDVFVDVRLNFQAL